MQNFGNKSLVIEKDKEFLDYVKEDHPTVKYLTHIGVQGQRTSMFKINGILFTMSDKEIFEIAENDNIKITSLSFLQDTDVIIDYVWY